MKEEVVSSGDFNFKFTDSSLPMSSSSSFPATPATSYAGASSAAPAASNTGAGECHGPDKSSGDSECVRLPPHQASSGADASVSTLSSTRPSCRPWERGDLLRRLSTFKLANMSGRTKVTSSLACAQRGWVNVDLDQIGCELCGAKLDCNSLAFLKPIEGGSSSEECFAQLDGGHIGTCPWRGNSCPDSLVQFPPTSSSALIGGYKDRFDGLLQFYSLPVVSSSTLEHMRDKQGSQIDRFLSQPPVHSSGETDKAEKILRIDPRDQQSVDLYFCAQKLISLCGWEPRWLPNVLDCEEHSIQSTKVGGTSNRSKDCMYDPSLSRKEFSTSSRKETGYNEIPVSEFRSESRSPLLDCSLCGATVKVWDFVTVPRPSYFAPCGVEMPQTSKKLTSARGVSEASGINGWVSADNADKEEIADEAATPDKRQQNDQGEDPNLTLASRMPYLHLNMTLASHHVQNAGMVKDLNDQKTSYEMQNSSTRNCNFDDSVSVADTPDGMHEAKCDGGDLIHFDNDNATDSEKQLAGPSKRAHDSDIFDTCQARSSKRCKHGSVLGYSLDVKVEGYQFMDKPDKETDQAIEMPSARDSTHVSSIVAMDKTFYSSDDESMESVENCPHNADGSNAPSVSINDTSELNCSFQGQQSVCIEPTSERVGNETGVSSSNADGEVLNTEIPVAPLQDGPSFDITGESAEAGGSHEAIENHGQSSELVLMPEETEQDDFQSNGKPPVAQSAGRTDTSNLNVFGEENSSHPSLSCNAAVYSMHEASREEVTQNKKGCIADENACIESNLAVADERGNRIRETGSGDAVKFDPIRHHNDCCPWVNGDVAAASRNSSSNDSSEGAVRLCGWQLTLDALENFQSIGPPPVQPVESESAASLCKGDHFTPGQKLVARHSFVRSCGS